MKKHSLIAVLLISVMTLSLVGCQKKDTGVLVTVGDTNVNNTDNKEKYNADDTELEVDGGNSATTETNEVVKEEKVREKSVEKSWYGSGTSLTLKDGNFHWSRKDKDTIYGKYSVSGDTITLTYTELVNADAVAEYTIVEYVDENENVVEEYHEDPDTHEIVDNNGNILHKNSHTDSSIVDVEQEQYEDKEIKLKVVELTTETMTITDENESTIEYKTNE